MTEWVAVSVALALATPLVVLGTECLVALFTQAKPLASPPALAPGVSYAVLVPAHNEAAILAKTLARLVAQVPGSDPGAIVLVADNCTDATASVARTLGVTVLERHDPDRRGKGFALDFGVRHLRAARPDVLVVMDADCETTQAALVGLINTVAATRLPAQMTYLMRVVGNASIKQKIAGFAWLLKNQVRPLAVDRLGLPAALSGTGMALPWQALETVNMGYDDIVENMKLSIDCALQGFPPVFCPGAVVYSDFPEQAAAELSQRTRWEHGHLQTITQQLPGLVQAAWAGRDWRLFALALDIGVPPLSLLVAAALAGLAGLALWSWLAGAAAALCLLAAAFAYFAAGLAAAWWRYGRGCLSARELLGVPHYVAGKLAIYAAFLSKRQKEWVRTDRDG